MSLIEKHCFRQLKCSACPSI